MGDVEVELEGVDNGELQCKLFKFKKFDDCLVNESVAQPDNEDKESEKGIPGFWYQCIANHPAIGSLLSDDDLGALEALTNISVEYNDSYSSFKLTFTFRENDYFTNKVFFKKVFILHCLLLLLIGIVQILFGIA